MIMFKMTGATIGGAIGWWLGSFVGFMTAYMVSTVLCAAGWYYGGLLAKRHLG